MVKKRLYQLKWDTEALSSYQTAFFYIQQESPSGAELLRTSVSRSLNLIKKHPWIFPIDLLKNNNDGSFRAYTIYSYRITNRIIDIDIHILRFRHTSREPLKY